MEKKKHFNPQEVRSSGHNLISLLYAIKSMVESHQLCAEEGRFPDIQRRLRHAEETLLRIHKYAHKALEVTKRLGHSVHEPSSIYLTSERAHLYGLWEKARKRFASETPQCVLETLTRIPDSFPDLQCRPKDLEEILCCLLGNAFDALSTDRPPKVVLRAEIGFSTQEEAFAILTFADNGSGIPPHQMSRLFQPFYTTKPAGKGNGLGLYLVKKLVTENKGRISVSSFEGQGTTFTIELPIAPQSLSKQGSSI